MVIHYYMLVKTIHAFHHFSHFNDLICSHNDAIQCVAYNPITHQLASCSSGDFGECTLS